MSDGSTHSLTLGVGSASSETKRSEIVISKAIYGVPGDPNKQVEVTGKIQALVSAGEKTVIGTNELAGRDPALGTPKQLQLVYSLDGERHRVSAAENEAIKFLDRGRGKILLAIDGWKTESTDHEGFTETRVAAFSLPKKVSNDQRVILDLGKVEIMAQVTLNGKTYDTLWMPPFELDVTDALKVGRNELAIRLTSTTNGKPKMSESVQLKSRFSNAVN